MRATRIDRIRAALNKHGPMTSNEISAKTKIPLADVCKLIANFRKNPGKKTMIRQIEKTREGGTRLSWIYELSNEPDVDVDALRPSSKPCLTREEKADLRRVKLLAKQIKPFHDPMIWLLFEDGLSTNTLEAEESRGGEVRASPTRGICEVVA